MNGGPAARYAVYFAPPQDHPLWRAGNEWLGREPLGDGVSGAPAREHVATPWRYGFHATLKPPMRLREGRGLDGLMGAVAALARDHRPFVVPALQVRPLTDFLALRPAAPLDAHHPLRRLADACVTTLEPYRAPLSPPEQQRQTKPHLSARQREQVLRYGYAHVLDDWRFHMTLTDSLSGVAAEQVDALLAEAKRHFAAPCRVPLPCDAVSVFEEREPGAPFVLLRRVALGVA